MLNFSEVSLSLVPSITKTPTNYTKTLDYTSPISTKYHQKLSTFKLIQFRHLSPVKYTHNKPCSRHHQNTYKLDKNPGLYITIFTKISPKTHSLQTALLESNLDTYPTSITHTITLTPCITKTPSNSTKTLDYTSPFSPKQARYACSHYASCYSFLLVLGPSAPGKVED